jgi:hypothetical protein
MWQNPAHNISKLTFAISHTFVRTSKLGWLESEPIWVLIGGHILFFGSRNLWISPVEVFAVLYGAFGTKCVGHIVCLLLLLFATPFLELKQHCHRV